MTADLKVIYEDDAILAVEKPAGVLVHADGSGAHTLSDDVAMHLLAEGKTSAEPQAVQRLDVDTTGIVLFVNIGSGAAEM